MDQRLEPSAVVQQEVFVIYTVQRLLDILLIFAIVTSFQSITTVKLC